MAKREQVYPLSQVATIHDVQKLIGAGEEFLKSPGGGDFIIDLADVPLVNSITLGAFLRIHNRFKQADRSLVLRNACDNVMHILHTTGLIHLLKIQAERVMDTDGAGVNISLTLDFEIYQDFGIFKFGGSMITPKDSELFYQTAAKILSDGYRMLLDMTDLVFIDSLGIQSILRLHRDMKEHKGEIKICNAGPILNELLERSSLTSVIRIYDSRDEALKGWR